MSFLRLLRTLGIGQHINSLAYNVIITALGSILMMGSQYRGIHLRLAFIFLLSFLP